MNENKTVKTTQRIALQYALDNLPDAPADVREKWEAMIASLDKKNSAERKPTAKQVENAGYKQNILDWMEAGAKYLSADIAKGVPALVEAGISGNRVTAMLTQLVNDGSIVRIEDKRKNYYSLAE